MGNVPHVRLFVVCRYFIRKSLCSFATSRKLQRGVCRGTSVSKAYTTEMCDEEWHRQRVLMSSFNVHCLLLGNFCPVHQQFLLQINLDHSVVVGSEEDNFK